MRLFLIAVTSAILATPAAATVTFSLPPLVLRALPGEISGWGFVIANDTNYIEITSAQYCVNPVSFPACTPPTLGTFTDFISGFNDIIVGPTGGTLPSSVAQAFHLPAHQGVGSFAFNPSAPVFAFDDGKIVLTYNVFDADPNSGAANLLFTGLTVSANTMIFVDAPEPSKTLSAMLGLVLLISLRISSPK